MVHGRLPSHQSQLQWPSQPGIHITVFQHIIFIWVDEWNTLVYRGIINDLTLLLPATQGRHRKMWTYLESFNEIKISYMLHRYPKICLCKIWRKQIIVLKTFWPFFSGAFGIIIIQSNANFLWILADHQGTYMCQIINVYIQRFLRYES